MGSSHTMVLNAIHSLQFIQDFCMRFLDKGLCPNTRRYESSVMSYEIAPVTMGILSNLVIFWEILYYTWFFMQYNTNDQLKHGYI